MTHSFLSPTEPTVLSIPGFKSLQVCTQISISSHLNLSSVPLKHFHPILHLQALSSHREVGPPHVPLLVPQLLMPPEASALPLGATPPLAPTALRLSAFADSLQPMKRNDSPNLLAQRSPNPNLRILPPKRAKPIHQPHRKRQRKIHWRQRLKQDN